MITLAKKTSELNESDFDLLSVYLQGGKVLVLPTDTIYGLSCLATEPDAIRKIFRIKGRETHKPLITLVSSIAMAKRYAHISKAERAILQDLWSEGKPPTTVILNAKNNLPAEIISASGGLSCRLPKSDFLIKIIRKVKLPLISTSLNLSGEAPITDIRQLNHFFSGTKQPDLVLDAGVARRRKPSRLIDLRNGNLKIIRK